jgi:hypothetical protein
MPDFACRFPLKLKKIGPRVLNDSGKIKKTQKYTYPKPRALHTGEEFTQLRVHHEKVISDIIKNRPID